MERKKILIVNQKRRMGGIRRSMETLVDYLSKHYDVDILFLSDEGIPFPDHPGVRVLPGCFALNIYLSPSAELRKKKWYAVSFLLKAVMKLAEKILGSERMTSLLTGFSRGLQGYDYAVAYSHDERGDGGFYGGCPMFVQKKVQAGRKYAWIHGEMEAIGLTTQTAVSTYRNFDCVILVSQACKREFDRITNGVIPSECVYNLINYKEIREKSIEQTEIMPRIPGIFRITTVSRLTDYAKRADRINVIAAELKNAGYCFEWIVIGMGAPGKIEKYITEAERLGLQNMVYYIGPRSNPYPFMLGSDLVAVVSDSESFSLVLNEAMILGVPAVTTGFPAAFEAVSDGETGFISERNTKALTQKIKSIIEHPEYLEQVRKNLRKTDPCTRNTFGSYEIVDKLFQV